METLGNLRCARLIKVARHLPVAKLRRHMETHVNIIPQETAEAATGPEVQERKNGGLSKGLLLLLFFLAAVNWASIFDRVMSADEQQDFSIFYTGGRIVWSGHAAQLYDLP